VMAGHDRLFVRADTREHHQRSIARVKPLWWPPAKVAGRYLAPYLATARPLGRELLADRSPAAHAARQPAGEEAAELPCRVSRG